MTGLDGYAGGTSPRGVRSPAARPPCGAGEVGIVRIARSYVGVPWKHQGRGQAGLDCVGLIYRVWCDLGLDPSVDGTGYGHGGDPRRLRQTLDRRFRRDTVASRGAVVLMAQKSISPLHVGIVAELRGPGIGRLVHVHAAHRKVVEQEFVPALGLRPAGFYRWPPFGAAGPAISGGGSTGTEPGRSSVQ